ncbi:hypothetical protein ACFQ1M_07930 [Sungkyunkwania multivorans]|uniref:Uncharacterized protein n=1 Tax=Sungkyunkwania multivorans TaxID=1173618 RepID=A0ABW3CXU9_9FLAO
MRFLLLFVLLNSYHVFGNDKKQASTIEQVTVYRSGAAITRIANVRLKECVLSWKMTLESKKNYSKQFSYRVKFPKGKKINL